MIEQVNNAGFSTDKGDGVVITKQVEKLGVTL